MQQIFFDQGFALLRTLLIGVLAYASLIVLLRLTGKRTLSKMNAFDFVVTVALGSTLASVLLSKDVSLAQGVLALALLIGLQFIITWLSVRVGWVRRLVTGEPSLLLYRGEFLASNLKRARITRDEVRAAVRAEGLAVLDQAEAVVLETDGSFSVVQAGSGNAESVLTGVRLPAAERRA